MKTALRVLLVTLVASLVTSAVATAHHSFAMFDRTVEKVITGTVARWQFNSPHSWLYVNVKNADGTTTDWAIEGGTPNTLFRRGITKETVPVGADIVVEGYQAKDGGRRANGRDITLPDGRKLFLANQNSAESPDSK